MQSEDEFRRTVSGILERAMNDSHETERLRRKRALDRERTTLKRLTKRARRLQVLGYSRKGIAAKLGVTEDDVWELLKEDKPC